MQAASLGPAVAAPFLPPRSLAHGPHTTPPSPAPYLRIATVLSPACAASPQYQGSVHVNAGYHPPRGNLDREVDKTKWVAKETFYNSVPSNRYVSSAGTERSATPLVPLDMSLS